MPAKSDEEKILQRLADECKIYRQEGIEILKGVAKIPAIEAEQEKIRNSIHELQLKYTSLHTMIIDQNKPINEKLDHITNAIKPILRKNKIIDISICVFAGLGVLFFISVISHTDQQELIKLLPFFK